MEAAAAELYEQHLGFLCVATPSILDAGPHLSIYVGAQPESPRRKVNTGTRHQKRKVWVYVYVFILCLTSRRVNKASVSAMGRGHWRTRDFFLLLL